MEKIGLNQLRSMFQDFYKEKGHYARKSFSLVPERDKSLLLINSGMAPLKPYFAGTEIPPSKRMTTCQKCIRTGDIENVGYTARHATFFEMLGSFSFGDYFKKESIAWGWEFIIDILKMPEEKIWASIYEKDDEAFDLWKNMIGMPEERIVRLGKDDNFWEIGVGPCGPCSELYFDRGEKYGCNNPDCKPGCECDRYVEFWNHVFTQYNRDEAGNYTPLPKPNIDTGMGLERLACIMQEVDSIFEIDTIKYILDSVVKLSTVSYHSSAIAADVSIRIITDHIRSVTFLIGDGVLPSNEGRGYVLRRLLRRAARHGRLIGIPGSFLSNLSEHVIEISKSAYPEIEEKRDYIKKILQIEEEKFSETIDQGMHILDEYMIELKALNTQLLSGDKAFKLYDTFGFPVELTKEILEENSYTVDMEGFKVHMEHQKQMARAARKQNTDAGWAENVIDYGNFPETVFTGYNNYESKALIIGIISDGAESGSALCGEKVRLILDQTPFYAESGGQIGDQGSISGEDYCIKVVNCEKIQGIFLHDAVLPRDISLGMPVNAIVDRVPRNATSRNHTSTHLLHQALREIVGKHIEQAGSLVSSERLRFDFTHFESLNEDELELIEAKVNRKIIEFIDVETEELEIEEAIKRGAIALFEKKYKNSVRVVSINNYSMELCGGTHVANTGQIGAFKIVSEVGVAAGIRRIEAITGFELYLALNKTNDLVEKVAELLKVKSANLLSKTSSLLEEYKTNKKELEEIKQKTVTDLSHELIANAYETKGILLITRQFDGVLVSDLRSLSDDIRSRQKKVIIVFATINAGRVMFMVSISDDLLEQGYHAGDMIKQISAAAGGGGGGKADMAQAGAKDLSKIPNAFEVAKALI